MQQQLREYTITLRQDVLEATLEALSIAPMANVRTTAAIYAISQQIERIDSERELAHRRQLEDDVRAGLDNSKPRLVEDGAA